MEWLRGLSTIVTTTLGREFSTTSTFKLYSLIREMPSLPSLVTLGIPSGLQTLLMGLATTLWLNAGLLQNPFSTGIAVGTQVRYGHHQRSMQSMHILLS